jgi:glycosyltransferase involved in cell wall biosynthesis
MHIGIDALLLHDSYSGVEQSIHHLLRELSREGGPHRYSVYVARDFGGGHLTRPGFGFQRLGFGGRERWRRIVWTHLGFARRARQDGVDLLHGPGYILPWRWRGHSVVTVYDLIALTHPELCSRANALYYRLFLPRTVARATAVVVPSATVKTQLVERLGALPEKLHVAPLGVEEGFTPDLDPATVRRTLARHGVQPPYFLCVGNLEPKKNLAATVEAFALARKKGDLPHQLVLAGGKSWQAGDVEQAIRRLPPGSVHRTGYVAQADLPDLYAGADLLLFWSLVEGFGLPALEAMACGTPVVCSDRGALPEVVGGAAVTVPIGPPSALADAILALLGDSERRAGLVQRGLERARAFTWRRHAEAVLRVYEEVGRL